MTFRFRYSLLTLLLLTAAVAVGVKLWRGPHRAAMSDPPTAAEQAILERTMQYHVHQQYFSPLHFEYDFMRTWEGLDCATVLARPVGKTPYLIIPTNLTYHFKVSPPFHAPPEEPSSSLHPASERLVCWIHSGQPPKTELHGGLPTVMTHPAYYLSSHKRVYDAVPNFSLEDSFDLSPIDVADIKDPAVRARIREELAKIPSPQ